MDTTIAWMGDSVHSLSVADVAWRAPLLLMVYLVAHAGALWRAAAERGLDGAYAVGHGTSAVAGRRPHEDLSRLPDRSRVHIYNSV